MTTIVADDTIKDELSFEELLEINNSKKELYPESVVDFIINTREIYENKV